MQSLVVLLLLVVACCWAVPTPPRVRLHSGGEVLGVEMTSRGGRPFAAFRGIPYARPPVGQLRFKAPVPLDPWSGVLNATTDAPICTQKNYFLDNPVVIGEEDCLYLNVYAPLLNVETSKRLLPVMVFIHGGGWFSGSGASFFEGPHYLMDKDVILITFNYRLGPLGFLSTGDAEAAGNYGLKDQVLVLHWVRHNVAAFGGDTKSVTIFGQSAGAASVHLLMLSTVAEGLFHKAISQSGVALNAWCFPQKEPLSLARRHASLLGCNQSDTSEMVQCLKNVDHHDLVDTTDKLKLWSVDPLTLYRPVVDPPDLSEEEKFMSEDPLVILSKAIMNASNGEAYRTFTKVPFMIGVVHNEGIMRAIPILTNPDLVASLNSQLDELLPKLLELDVSINKNSHPGKEEILMQLYNSIKSHFLLDLPLSLNDSEKFINLYTERGFLHGVQQTAVYHRMAGHEDLFVYSFEYRGSQSYTSVFAKTSKNYGVCHCDELLYLFPTPALFPHLPEEILDWRVVDEVTSMWANFATYGKPTTETENNTIFHELSENKICREHYTEAIWPNAGTINKSYAVDKVPYLQITENDRYNATYPVKLCSQHEFGQGRIAFWKSLPLVENEVAALAANKRW